MSDEELSQAEVGFGWNYETAGETNSSRNVDVSIRPDNSYAIQINAYRYDAEPKILKKTNGQLDSEIAARVRRGLGQLRSREGADLYTTLPNCPDWDQPAIQYYVGFKVANKPAVTVIERNCDSPETVEARKIVEDAFRAFPQIDLTHLNAGSTDL